LGTLWFWFLLQAQLGAALAADGTLTAATAPRGWEETLLDAEDEGAAGTDGEKPEGMRLLLPATPSPYVLVRFHPTVHPLSHHCAPLSRRLHAGPRKLRGLRARDVYSSRRAFWM
jgi:hypothetical protein